MHVAYAVPILLAAAAMTFLQTAAGCSGPQPVQPMSYASGFVANSSYWYFNVGDSGITVQYPWLTTNDPNPSSADVNWAELTLGSCSASWNEATVPGTQQTIPFLPASSVNVVLVYPSAGDDSSSSSSPNCSYVQLKISDASSAASKLPWGLLRGCNLTVSNWTDSITGDGYNGYKGLMALTRNVTVVAGQLSAVRTMKSTEMFSLTMPTTVTVQIGFADTISNRTNITINSGGQNEAYSTANAQIRTSSTSDAAVLLSPGAWLPWLDVKLTHTLVRMLYYVREAWLGVTKFAEPYQFRVNYRMHNPTCPDLFVRTHRTPLVRDSEDHVALRECLRRVMDATINDTVRDVPVELPDHSISEDVAPPPPGDKSWDNLWIGQIFHWNYALDNSTGCSPLIDQAPTYVHGSQEFAELRECLYNLLEYKMNLMIAEDEDV